VPANKKEMGFQKRRSSEERIGEKEGIFFRGGWPGMGKTSIEDREGFRYPPRLRGGGASV